MKSNRMEDDMTDDEAAEAYMAALAELERNPWRERAEAAERAADSLERALLEERERVAALVEAIVGQLCGDITCARCFKFRDVLKETDLEN